MSIASRRASNSPMASMYEGFNFCIKRMGLVEQTSIALRRASNSATVSSYEGVRFHI